MTRTTPIRWNHLHLDIPEQWDVIVKDKRHLILEQELRPIIEMRWQPPAQKSRGDAGEKIAKQLEPGRIFTRRQGQNGALPAGLNDKFKVDTFRLDNSPEDTVLLLTCKSCATALLIRIYHRSIGTFEAFAPVLGSLNCHPDPAALAGWQIQDFYFSIPAGFELQSSSFRFGLTSLNFTSSAAELRLCRLAPASQHLQQNSLSALFQSFSSAPPEKQTAAQPSTLHFRHVPTLSEYLWGRIRRKKPYQTSSFIHFPHHDRIFGYSIRSRTPIETWVETMLEEGYGIIPKEEAAAGPDA